MDIKNLVTSYQGRIRRLHFWLGLLGLGIVFGVLYGILGAVLGPKVDAATGVASINPLYMPVSLILAIPYLYMVFAIYVKRAHDRNRAWWFSLLFLVPLLNLWPLIELGFLPGTPGDNQYGPDPKAAAAAAPAAA
jgi:uncharacterized membrane protein YhaH (DUF805 family)